MIKKIWQHKNLYESFRGALQGLVVVLRTERNAKIIFAIGVIVLLFAGIIGLSWFKLALLIFVVISVFICEVFNTLVENICDIIRPKNDPHIKILKDIGSAAVLIACVSAVLIGCLILLPKMLWGQ